jgi:dethiobiotin synthetase
MLGTINHSVLTIEAAKNDGAKVIACVLSRKDESLETALANLHEIERLTGVPTFILDDSDKSCLGKIDQLAYR